MLKLICFIGPEPVNAVDHIFLVTCSYTHKLFTQSLIDPGGMEG